MLELTQNQIGSLQEILDGLRKIPEYREYVDQHKLKLIDNRYIKLDELLDSGVLK